MWRQHVYVLLSVCLLLRLYSASLGIYSFIGSYIHKHTHTHTHTHRHRKLKISTATTKGGRRRYIYNVVQSILPLSLSLFQSLSSSVWIRLSVCPLFPHLIAVSPYVSVCPLSRI